MRKNVNVEETNSKKTPENEKKNENILIGVCVGITAVGSVFMAVYSTNLDKWKTERYSKWSADFYDKLEKDLYGMSSSYKNKAHEIVASLIKRFYNAPTKSLANKNLKLIKEFTTKLSGKTNNEKAQIVLEYAAKYIVPDVVRTKQSSFAYEMGMYTRY